MLRSLRYSVLAACLVGASFAQSPSPFTLEQILSSPFPTSLVAAPNHGKLAWVQNAEGKRNIWVALAPDYEAKQLTGYDSDDGQELTGLHFGPGANHIIFIRGGAPNSSGEIPNPLSVPDGADRSIWIIEAAGGEVALAQMLSVSRQFVNRVKQGEKLLPVTRCLTINEAFPQITLHELRPDIYPE